MGIEEAGASTSPIPLNENKSLLTKNGKPTKHINSPQKIRYLPDEIKIYKTGGKRTASGLCSFGGKQHQKETLKESATNRVNAESVQVFGSKSENLEIKQGPSSSAYSTFTYSDMTVGVHKNMDDVMSIVSDLSDISVMSSPSTHLGMSLTGRHENVAMTRKASSCNMTQTHTIGW